VARFHIGPPSPISAHTGPFTSKVVTVGGMEGNAPDPDLRTTHYWIFASLDTPLDTASVFFFEAEIAAGVTSFGDTLPDASLDQSRQAPFANLPPPLATVLAEYEGRLILMDLVGQRDVLQLSGNEEITLGIPQECFPLDMQFQVPSGAKRIRGGIASHEQSFFFGTQDWWFALFGNSAATFNKRDHIVGPGPAGPQAFDMTPSHLVWWSKDRKVRAWNGSMGQPAELTKAISEPSEFRGFFQTLGYSTEDIPDAQVENVKVKWFSWGRYNWVLVFADLNGDGNWDWVQLWDATGFAGGDQDELAESDMFPSHKISGAEIVQVAGKPFVFLGDQNGFVYRFPDGYTDAGIAFSRPFMSTVWQDFHEVVGNNTRKHFKWIDLHTDRTDAITAFDIFGITLDTPDFSVIPAKLPQQQLPNAQGADTNSIRAYPEQVAPSGVPQIGEVSAGKWHRTLIIFPSDGKPASIERIGYSIRPLQVAKG
jgi:hypothetical protein